LPARQATHEVALDVEENFPGAQAVHSETAPSFEDTAENVPGVHSKHANAVAYLPASHLEQLALMLGADPGGQPQDLLPGGDVISSGHSAQEYVPTTSLYLPAWHLLHGPPLGPE